MILDSIVRYRAISNDITQYSVKLENEKTDIVRYRMLSWEATHPTSLDIFDDIIRYRLWSWEATHPTSLDIFDDIVCGRREQHILYLPISSLSQPNIVGDIKLYLPDIIGLYR